MSCPACTPGAEGALCERCLAKVKILRPATRATVDAAAFRSRRLIGDTKGGDNLIDFLERGRSAGRRW